MQRAWIGVLWFGCGGTPETELLDASWEAPTLIATLEGDDPTLTGDLLELYFDHTSDDIFVMTRADLDAPWSTPAIVIELSGPAGESTPEVSADGLTMLLASDRAGGLGALDLWMATRETREAAWSTPVAVLELATAEDEFAASMSADERTIVLTRNATARDLHVATRESATDPWPSTTPLAELNTPGLDAEPHLSSDALVVYFASDRGGSVDLYAARREALDRPFDVEALPGDVNTSAAESDPWVSLDERTLFFIRDDNQLWMATR